MDLIRTLIDLLKDAKGVHIILLIILIIAILPGIYTKLNYNSLLKDKTDLVIKLSAIRPSEITNDSIKSEYSKLVERMADEHILYPFGYVPDDIFKCKWLESLNPVFQKTIKFLTGAWIMFIFMILMEKINKLKLLIFVNSIFSGIFSCYLPSYYLYSVNVIFLAIIQLILLRMVLLGKATTLPDKLNEKKG